MLHCSTFRDLEAGAGYEAEIQLPGTGVRGSSTLVGTLRTVADWNEAASDLNLYMGFPTCPNVGVLLRGGCVTLLSDVTSAKPATFQGNVESHDLTVDAASPGKRRIYVHNAGPRTVSGALQVTLTTGGTSSGGVSCTSVPVPTPTPTSTPSPTPRPTATPTPSGGICAKYPRGGDAYNCSDFSPPSDAQKYHDQCDPNDRNRLDADGDGKVCE